MFSKNCRAAALVGAVVLLSACSSSSGPSAVQVPVPESQGIYAIVDGDELQRLDGNPEWENESWGDRSDLRAGQHFVIYDPVLAERTTYGNVDVEIWQVAWVRSTIRADGSAAPVEGSQWAVARLAPFKVPVSVRGVGDRSEVVYVVPQEPLAPGLYSIQVRQGAASRNARFGVHWSSVDRAEYSALHCVDHRLGSGSAYQPCDGRSFAAAEPAAGTPTGGRLEISLTDPQTTTFGDRRLLIVEGTVTNKGATTRTVPVLKAELLDKAGSPLTSWTFRPEDALVQPGGSTPFRTQILEPPPGTARVNVNFVPASTSSLP